jgi:PAS domain S-box-containing protein
MEVDEILEAEREKSEERFRALVNATSDVIYSMSADWEVMRELDGRGFLKDTHGPITGWRSRNVHPDDLEKVNIAINAAIRDKKIFELEHKVWRADGTPGWTFSRAVPILDAQGKILEWFGTASDITERKHLEEMQAQSSEELQTINEEMAASNEELASINEELTASNEEMILLNRELMTAQQKIEEGEVALRLAINAANFGSWFIHSVTREFVTDARLKELFGYEPDEALSIEGALAQIREDYRGYVATALENAIYKGGDYDVTYPVIGLHDEKLRWLRAIGNLKADPSGAFSAFTGVVMDITEQYLAAKKVERAEESLRMAVDAAELGTYYINATDRIFVASPKLKELFGFLPDEEVPYDAAINQIHPDYRQQALDLVEAAFTKGIRFDMEYPIIGHHDGKIRWVRGIGEMQHSESKDYFTGVLHEITEKKMDELRKNDFIGMVSHELKTPLTSLNAYLQMLQQRAHKSGDDFTGNTMDQSLKQVKKMNTMINGFLNVSRLESGKIHIDKKLFDMAELVKESEAETILMNSSHTFIFRPVVKTIVNADKDKIGQVIHNLISNAVKYSKSGSTIQIACLTVEGCAQFSVTDEGMGIAPQHLSQLFQRYYRVENNNNISGFGIGLYLSAEIIQRHEGKIWVESELGRGSTFYFILPL